MSPERAAALRPSRPCLRLLCPRPRAWLLGLVLLVGLSACGSPSPEAPRSGLTSGSAGAVVASLAGHAAGAGSVATDPQRQGSTSTTLPGASNWDEATSGAPLPNDPRAAQSASGPPPSDAQSLAEQAQREARELWFTEARESPDATVRLQALTLWAQQPGTGIDPLPYALVDEDEAVRARAEALYEQQRAREASVP